MKAILNRIPLPMGGLILGVASLGNFIRSYGEIFRNLLGVIAGFLFILYSLKLLTQAKEIKKELANPVVAGVFPAFFMATMVLSTYVQPIFYQIGLGMWILGLAAHICWIFWFFKRFVLSFNIKNVFPTWFVAFVGIGVGAVTAGTFGLEAIGRVSFWTAFILLIPLLFLVLFRVFKIGQIPETALPTLTIFAAPWGLCLTGYMNSFLEKNLFMVGILVVLSLIFYFSILMILPRLLRLDFYPSFSSFTFPMIIGGMGLKLTNEFFFEQGIDFWFLKYLINFQEFVAVSITCYVLIKYLAFLYPATVSVEIQNIQ